MRSNATVANAPVKRAHRDWNGEFQSIMQVGRCVLKTTTFEQTDSDVDLSMRSRERRH
jgi:hypothetical protein